MNNNRVRIAVIIGSTREGRFAQTVANWFIGRARRRRDIDIDVIDLADVHLPTTLPQQRTPEVETFGARVRAADAIVVVTPEFNHGYPASLKLAIDSLYTEWQAKPVGFVSYGGISGGLRAVEQLRQVFAELHMVSIRDTVSFHNAHSRFDESGEPKDSAAVNAAAATMLNQIVWWAMALRNARLAQPYAA